MLKWIINLVSNTIGKWHFPWVDKAFNLEDYFLIEKELRDLDCPFAVGIVKTNGHGSNLLIRIVQLLSSDSRKRKSEVTHALAHIGINKGYKHSVVESLGDGIREVSLLKAIGQRDRVILRMPNPQFLNKKLCEHAVEYIKEVAKRDAYFNIQYDNAHNYEIIPIEDIKDYSTINVKLDCSETIMQAIEHGFKMTGQKSMIKMEMRGGISTWSPEDIHYSRLFITFYDSEGDNDGRI